MYLNCALREGVTSRLTSLCLMYVFKRIRYFIVSLVIVYCNENAVQYLNTLMMMIYTIGYRNVADMYIELNNQLANHDLLALCLLSFDM